MTLNELRAQLVENVNMRAKVSDMRLVRIINRAVEHIANLVELQFKPYNVSTTPITVTVSASTVEYTVGSPGALRKIINTERTDTGVSINARIIDYRTKNEYRSSGWIRLGGRSDAPVLYYRRDNTGQWYVGFPSDPGTSMTLKVYYAPAIVALVTNASIPYEVPVNHHELIAVRATILLLSQLQQETKMWERQYAELRQMLEMDLSNWNRKGPRVRRIVPNLA